MNTALLLEAVRAYWPDPKASHVSVEPIEKGGSSRRFYRIHAGKDRSLIAVSYPPGSGENARYAEVASFLAEAGVRVPKVYFHDPDRGLMFLEDMGDEDLWRWRAAPWAIRRSLYFSAVAEVVKIHGAATRLLPLKPLKLEKEFNEQLYLWEQNYFIENCLQAVFGLPEPDARALAGGEFFREVAKRLAQLPRVLIHRDFQSQNILICRGRAGLIDFQGLRPGLPHYDLASLIYDPYVGLSSSEREEIMKEWLRLAQGENVPLEGDFDETLALCAMQRLMQAMGAYGFLGLRMGKSRFLNFIPPAAHSLAGILRKFHAPSPLAQVLEHRLPRQP